MKKINLVSLHHLVGVTLVGWTMGSTAVVGINSASIVQQGNFAHGGGGGGISGADTTILGADDLRLPPHTPPYTSSILSQSQSERQSQETDPTLEMELGSVGGGGGGQENNEGQGESEAETVPVMMDPPVDGGEGAAAAAEEAEDAGQSAVEVEIEVNANGYDYSSYADLLNKQWPMMTEKCVNGVNQFDPLTQKKVYTVGVMAPAGLENAWRQHNITFTKYLNAVVGPRFDPPISFEMEVTDRPLHDWVRRCLDVFFVVCLFALLLLFFFFACLYGNSC